MILQEGRPVAYDSRALNDCQRRYAQIEKELLAHCSLLANKLIVPNQLRQEMINKIHESHLGIVKCKARGRDILYWPGMSTQIEDAVSRCATCNENRNNNQKEPLFKCQDDLGKK